jgi:hypothetical protein
LIEQSSKSFIEGKILQQMELGQVDYRQNRVRDNILVSIKVDDTNGPGVGGGTAFI